MSQSIAFNYEHPNYPYDLYVQNEEARYQAALNFRTEFLAKQERDYFDQSLERAEYETAEAAPERIRQKAAYDATLKARDAARPAPVYKPFVQLPETYVIPPYKGTYSSRSEEWSSNNKGPTNPAKFYASKLNHAHAAFLAGELTIEEYTDEVYSYLEPNSSSEDVYAFLHSITETLEAGTFCPADAKTKFSTKIKSAWKAHQQSQGISTSLVEDQGQEEAIADDPAPIIGCKATVSVGEKSIRAAYDGYVARVPDAETHLIGLSLQYARRTIRSSMSDLPEGTADFEDAASRLAEKIWQSLPSFKGDSLAYFKWLNRAQQNANIDFIRKTKREKDNSVPLMVEFEDGELEQNPLIDRQHKQEHHRELPDWIQGNDLWICKLIRANRSYAEIGKFLHISEPAVKERVAKMKKRNLEEAKASGAVKRIRVRGEWVDSIE